MDLWTFDLRCSDVDVEYIYIYIYIFYKGKLVPAEISISSETGRNWPERPKHPETDWNLTRGGMDGTNVSDCTPVWKIPAGTELITLILDEI